MCVCEEEAIPLNNQPEDEHGKSDESYMFSSEQEEEFEEEDAMEEEQQQHQGEDGAKSSRAKKFVGKLRSAFE